MKPTAPVHFENDGIDGNIFDIVLDAFVGWFCSLHEEVFEPFDFLSKSKGNAQFFDTENVALAVVFVFFNEGLEQLIGNLLKSLVKMLGIGHRDSLSNTV